MHYIYIYIYFIQTFGWFTCPKTLFYDTYRAEDQGRRRVSFSYSTRVSCILKYIRFYKSSHVFLAWVVLSCVEILSGWVTACVGAWRGAAGPGVLPTSYSDSALHFAWYTRFSLGVFGHVSGEVLCFLEWIFYLYIQKFECFSFFNFAVMRHFVCLACGLLLL